MPGAPAGRKGSGCYKLSAEEKERMTVAQRAAAKKLKAQQKSSLGKVDFTGITCSVTVASGRLQGSQEDRQEDCQEGSS